MHCADCHGDREVGSRCFRCYVQWLGRKFGLARYRWWSEKLLVIVGALRGRYEMIRLGQDTPPPENTLRFLWSRDPRPMWATHPKAAGAPSRIAVLRIIALVEARARREHENDNRGPQDG